MIPLTLKRYASNFNWSIKLCRRSHSQHPREPDNPLPHLLPAHAHQQNRLRDEKSYMILNAIGTCVNFTRAGAPEQNRGHAVTTSAAGALALNEDITQ